MKGVWVVEVPEPGSRTGWEIISVHRSREQAEVAARDHSGRARFLEWGEIR